MPTLPAIDFAKVFQEVITTYGPAVASLVGLIVLEVVSGIAAALKRGMFDWQKVANFYRTSVMPGLVGWLGLVFSTYLVVPGLFGDAVSGVVSPAVALSSLLAVVATLVASIRANLAELIAPAPAKSSG